jgi:hypothetical protein
MTGVTCMITANGKKARSIMRDCANSIANATPPRTAANSASKVMCSVTNSEPHSVPQSLIRVSIMRLGAGRI